jgi:hypothetical protein
MMQPHGYVWGYSGEERSPEVISVFVAEQELPKDTGLVTEAGVKIVRLCEKRPIGFWLGER